MNGCPTFKRAGSLSFLAVLLLATALVPRAASASGSVAVSGSFYAQRFEIPGGSTVGSSSIYVVAFNQGTEAARFVLGYTAPPHVTLDLSETDFVLDPAQSKRVLVAVRVGADAVPGFYEITVNVKALGGGSGVELLGAAEQVASLTIVDKAGRVRVESVSPLGDSIRAHIRLWKVISGNEYEYTDSHTGVLDVVVSPGSYVVKAFSTGVEFASRRFSVAHGEQKSISMTVETVYFKSFDVVMNNEGTEGSDHAQVLYTVANVYRPTNEASVDLVVMLDGAHLETIPAILKVGVLDIGERDESYSYIPSEGWQEGTYSYRLELSVGGELYASTRNVTPGDGGNSQGSWLWVVWVILGVVCIAGLGLLSFFLRKRRRREEEKPGKT